MDRGGGGGGMNNHWNKKSLLVWKVVLFVGSVLVYSTRVTLSVCAVDIGHELGWDKRISVSLGHS